MDARRTDEFVNERSAHDSAPDSAHDSAPTAEGAAGKPRIALDPRDLLPEAVLGVSHDGWLLWTNAAAEELLGGPASQWIGEPFSKVLPVEDRAPVARWFLRRARNGEREHARQVRVCTPGGPRWVGLRVRQVPVNADKSVFVCLVHDLHDVHLEIESLRQQARELIAQIQEARAASQTKSEMLATMSDLLRTPMNGVLGMSRMLMDAELPPDQQMVAEIIHDSGERLLALIDDILDFSRIEAGSLDLDAIHFDLRMAVENVVSTLGPSIVQGVDVRCNVHPRVPSLLVGDPGRLRQVLFALGDCVLRFTPMGRVSVAIELCEESVARAALRFRVTAPRADCGLDGDIDVLAAFADADTRFSGRHGGSQMGLSVARRIVALMGGECGLERDAEAKQTTLWFRVTLAKQAEVAPTAAHVDETPAAHEHGGRVLVADPDASARAALIRAATTCGFSCDEAESGIEALSALRRSADSPYRAVFVDLALSDLRPAELAAAVGADDRLGAPALVLVTNLGRQGDALAAEAAGFQGYFVKPLEPRDMLDAVRDIRAGAPALVTRHWLAENRHRARRAVVWLGAAERDGVAAILRRLGYTVAAPEEVEDAARLISNHAPQVVFAPGDAGATEVGALYEAALRAATLPVMISVGACGDGWSGCIPSTVLEGPLEPESVAAALDSAGNSESMPAAASPVPTAPTVLALPLDAGDDATLSDTDGKGHGNGDSADKSTPPELVQRWREALARLHGSVSNGDCEGIVRETGVLRPLCQDAGAMRCVAVVDQLEREARDGMSAAVVRWAHHLQAEFDAWLDGDSSARAA